METQNILKLGLEYPVVSLDPRIGGDHISALLLKMLFEGLMREDRNGNIEYGVAKSVDISPDLKTYLFRLHPTRWSDGSLVTAFDFEYSWKKALSPSFKTPFTYLFYPIKNAELAKKGEVPPESIGIHALDEMTLKVELKSPTPYFLELTSHPLYSPVHRLIDQLHPNWPFEEKSSYLCNGAFQLIKNNPSQGYELIKNPLYYGEKSIRLDKVYFLKVNRRQAFEMFQKSNNHWVGIPLTTWEPHFIPCRDDEFVNFLSKSVYWYTFNCEKPPFNHKKMRQALSMAIDRSYLISFFNTQPATSPLPSEHSLVRHPLTSFFDPQKAKILFNEALEEVNLSRETFPSITLTCGSGYTTSKLAEIISTFWQATFNIQCTTLPVEWNSLFERMAGGDYQVGCIVWQPWVNDPMYTLNAFRDAKEPMNFPKWENKKYQELLHLAEREVDPQKRNDHYLQAEQILLDEQPVTPIFSSFTQTLKKKKLNITCPSGFINFKWAYFEA